MGLAIALMDSMNYHFVPIQSFCAGVFVHVILVRSSHPRCDAFEAQLDFWLTSVYSLIISCLLSPTLQPGRTRKCHHYKYGIPQVALTHLSVTPLQSDGTRSLCPRLSVNLYRHCVANDYRTLYTRFIM